MSNGTDVRASIKHLLSGHTSDPPLVLPIVFSLGARIADIGYDAYLANPTKIANALLQINNFLRARGAACYFDPGLEAAIFDALSPTDTAAQDTSLPLPARVDWPTLQHTRAGVAVEVIERLNRMLPDDVACMAGATGPFKLASRYRESAQHEPDWPELVDFADRLAAVIGVIATQYVASGAGVVFLYETAPPPRSTEDFEDWTSVLLPLCNAIRFYEALPVICLPDAEALSGYQELLHGEHWPCVFALPLAACEKSGTLIRQAGLGLGVALPAADFQSTAGIDMLIGRLEVIAADIKPVLITTDGDIPLQSDLALVKTALASISSRWPAMSTPV